MQEIKDKYAHLLHKIGLGMSFLCAIHCLAMPFVLVAAPMLGEAVFSERVELLIFVSSLLMGLVLLKRDYNHHMNKFPLVLILVSGALGLVLHLLPQASFLHDLMPLASIGMASAFLLNWRLHRKACHTHY